MSDKTYISVFVALLALTAVTYGTARLDLGAWNMPIGIFIAGIKAILVMLYFMHLRQSSWTIRFAVLAGLLWFSVLLALTMNDYITRGW